MRRIYRGDHSPVTILVEQPPTRPKAFHHAADGDLLFARKPK
jgi:hypothetical protein